MSVSMIPCACGAPMRRYSACCRDCYYAARRAWAAERVATSDSEPSKAPLRRIEPFGLIRVPEGSAVYYVRRGAANGGKSQ